MSARARHHPVVALVSPPAHPKARPRDTTVLEKVFFLFLGAHGHSLRDTWMSSVTLNTPEVTKLSWKSVESAQEREGRALRGGGGPVLPPVPPTSP